MSKGIRQQSITPLPENAKEHFPEYEPHEPRSKTSAINELKLQDKVSLFSVIDQIISRSDGYPQTMEQLDHPMAICCTARRTSGDRGNRKAPDH